MLEEIADLAGLARTDPALALGFAIFMFSMAGIPPLAGFWGKFFIFTAAVQSGLWTLAVIGVLTSVVGAFYYIRIVKVMYFDAADEAFDRAARLALGGGGRDRPVHHLLLRGPGAVRGGGGSGGESVDFVTPADRAGGWRSTTSLPSTAALCRARAAAGEAGGARDHGPRADRRRRHARPHLAGRRRATSSSRCCCGRAGPARERRTVVAAGRRWRWPRRSRTCCPATSRSG